MLRRTVFAIKIQGWSTNPGKSLSSMRLWSPIQKFAKKKIFINFEFFFKIFLDTHIKKTSVGQMIACYKQNIDLLPFADVFLKSLFVFAGGR